MVHLNVITLVVELNNVVFGVPHWTNNSLLYYTILNQSVLDGLYFKLYIVRCYIIQYYLSICLVFGYRVYETILIFVKNINNLISTTNCSCNI